MPIVPLGFIESSRCHTKLTLTYSIILFCPDTPIGLCHRHINLPHYLVRHWVPQFICRRYLRTRGCCFENSQFRMYHRLSMRRIAGQPMVRHGWVRTRRWLFLGSGMGKTRKLLGIACANSESQFQCPPRYGWVSWRLPV